jgi:uroporphyrinogen-III synthase
VTRAAANRRTIWITRAEPGASATAARVRALGCEPIVQPLLAVRPVAHAVIDLAGAAALAFTSANAVTAFGALSWERGLPVFAVGDATAAAARKAGFGDVASATGDVAALAATLKARAPDLRGVIVYPAAARPARDLAALIADAGLTLREVAVYETVDIPPPDAFIARLPALDGVLIHSARAGLLLASILRAHPAPRLVAYALSREAARSLTPGGLARIHTAAAPNEAALLEELAKARRD